MLYTINYSLSAIKETGMIKKAASLVLCLALAVSAAVSAPLSVYADRSDIASDPSSVRSVQSVRQSGEEDPKDSFVFSDRFFTGDSYRYDGDLALASFELCLQSLPDMRHQDDPEYDKDTSGDLRDYLTDNGFVDYETNGYYTRVIEPDTAGVACAHKKVTDNGREYTLLAVVPRSATYGGEWYNNFLFSKSADDKGDNAGFAVSRDAVLDFAGSYAARHGISGDVKLWIAGYSRGAGVVNEATAKLLRDPAAVFGSRIRLEPSDVYCYTFGTPRTAPAAAVDDAVYGCIHNVYDDTDVLSHMPPASMGFDRYGSNVKLTALFDKQLMLRLLKADYEKSYESFKDPDDFTPLRIDISSALKGDLKFVPDTDSYIPADGDAYLESVTETIAAVSARASKTGDAREGYYTTYQGPLSRLGYYAVAGEGSGLSVGDIFGGKYGIPMLLSMYVMFMVDKNQSNVNEELNVLIESTFNQLAYYVEDDNGSVKAEYNRIAPAYLALRKAFFAGSSTASEASQKYVLTKDLRPYRSIFLRASKKLTAELYERTIRDALADSDVDKATVEQLAVEDGDEMSYLLAYLFLSNTMQSKAVRPFSFNNEQFKQLATFAGSISYFTTYHSANPIISCLRAAVNCDEDDVTETAAQRAGYRRVYLPEAAGADFSGTVSDASGRTVAVFKNDEMISRTDEWIGITKCDTGSWLRLPVDASFEVSFTPSAACRFGIRASEYDISKGEEVRTVSSDSRFDWTSLSAAAGDEITLNVPAIETDGDGYTLPSEAAYSLSMAETPAARDSWLIAKAVSSKNGTLKITWAGSGDAERYLISVSEKGKSGSAGTRTVSGSTRAYVWKGLKKGRVYRFTVTAQRAYGNGYADMSKSKPGYVIAGNTKGKYTNPKSVSLNRTSVTLNEGGSFKLKAKIKKVKKSGKLPGYTAALRYISTDSDVASVSNKGLIRANGSGKCKIYVQAVNGVWNKITVTVR